LLFAFKKNNLNRLQEYLSFLLFSFFVNCGKCEVIKRNKSLPQLFLVFFTFNRGGNVCDVKHFTNVCQAFQSQTDKKVFKKAEFSFSLNENSAFGEKLPQINLINYP